MMDRRGRWGHRTQNVRRFFGKVIQPTGGNLIRGGPLVLLIFRDGFAPIKTNPTQSSATSCGWCVMMRALRRLEK